MTERRHLYWNTFFKACTLWGQCSAAQPRRQYSQVASLSFASLLFFFLRRQLELINVQPGDRVFYPNILKSQDMSGRSLLAPLVGHRVNKCKSCLGSAPQLCTSGLIVDFVISPRDAKPGSLEKNEATPLQQVGASCRCGCVAQRFVLRRGVSDTQAGEGLEVRFKETSVVLMTEAGAALVREVLSDFQYQHVTQFQTGI